VTPRETLYRVYDPRQKEGQRTEDRGQKGPAHPPSFLLRHLSEAELLDAVHPDEYRQRFAAAAAVRHPHLAATLEVLEIAGRPAVLQESVSGLASGDWPALITAPGVWLRLVSEAADGVHALHAAGLVHGRLTPAGGVP